MKNWVPETNPGKEYVDNILFAGATLKDLPILEAPIQSSRSYPMIAPAPPVGGGMAKGGALDNNQPSGVHRAILDIPTPESGQMHYSGEATPTPESGQIKKQLSRVGRRFFSRCVLGLKLPGRYYFITWTSSPQSPPLKKSWGALRKWLKRKRPGMCWCYCMTDEGHGVIHMIVRLGKGEKRLDVKEVRAHWSRLHKAKQIHIDHVPESMKDNLSAYLSDQRHKKKLGGEMAWQDGLERWRWSKGWLPKGFTKEFGWLWYSLRHISHGQREKAVSDWLNACHVDGDKIETPPRIGWDGEIEYPKLIKVLDPLVDLEANWKSIEFDKTLKNFDWLPDVTKEPDPDDWCPEDGVTKAKWEAKYRARLQRLDSGIEVETW